jgi:threonine-phosphate decarboxylase
MSRHNHSLARDFSVRADVDGPLLESQLDREHGGNVHAWARRAGVDPDEIIDFSASINPLGPPASARKAFLKSYGEISRYPDPYGAELKQALAKRHEMEPEHILLGNGSTQLIYLLCATLRPLKALVVGPAFSEYANALKLAGAKITFLPLAADRNFSFSTEKFMAAWEKDHDIVFLATPNSVTGQLIPRAEIERVARLALMKEKLLVIDEAFIDFVEGESAKDLIRENPHLIVLRSLTKYYALPGLRLGFLLAQFRRVKQLAAHQEPWAVNGLAQKVALACLADASFRSKTERWLQREGSFLSHGLTALKGFHPYPSTTNFLLVRIEDETADASELRAFLLRRKMLIRPCDSFVGLGPDYFRVTVKRRKDNQRLLDALKEWTA